MSIFSVETHRERRGGRIGASSRRTDRGGRDAADPPGALRDFYVLCFCSLLLTTYRLYAVGGRYEVREIKPNVFVWIPEDIIDQDSDPQFSRAGTAGFIVTPDAVVAVDTTNSPFHARELLYEIRRRTEAPVKYVVNTGSRGDYTLGNEVFVDQQASIVSSTMALAQMRQYQQELARRLDGDWRLQLRIRGFHPTLPARTFEGELQLSVSGQEIKLVSGIPGNSSGDLIVYLPGAKVLFLADLYENRYFPRIDSSPLARDVRRWIEFLQQVENWDVEIYVPGHGEPGGKKELADFRLFLQWLTHEVDTRIKEGKTLDQVKRELGSLENYHWHAPELGASAVEGVYRQLVGAGSVSVPNAAGKEPPLQ